MKIVYMSLTGQTRKFVQKLECDSLELKRNQTHEISEPYVVIVPTYDPVVTKLVDDFIDYKHNRDYLKGVCGSGNLNFNDLFCFSAKDIAKKYEVPLLHCFEFNGTEKDVERVKMQVKNYG